MPKTVIDYSNTIIYKITCKDTSVKDVYVGHTTNFVQRKHAHKQSCINAKSTNHKCKLYTIIRENGGWKNWTMEIVNFFNCNDHYEARIKEQEYFILLNATLNSIEPMPKPKSTIKPLHNVIETFPNVIEITETQEKTHTFKCVACNFVCCKNSDYKRHLSTRKHKLMTNDDNFTQKNAELYICNNCNKCYKYRQGLSLHKKKCHNNAIPPPDTSNDVVIDKELVMRLIKENSELKTSMIDLQNKMMDVLKIATNNSVQPI
jgi:hypothetical protein